MENRKKTAQEVLADFRRQEILNAALELTVQHGRHALTMERVAEKAGVAKGTVYLYFKDKQELVRGLLDELSSSLSDTMCGILREETSLWTKLHDMFTRTLEKSIEYRETLILIHRTLGDIDECDEEGRSKYESIYEVMLEVLQEEKEKGNINTDISNENLAYAFLAMLRGSVLIDAADKENGEEEPDARQIVDLFVRGMGGQTERTT